MLIKKQEKDNTIKAMYQSSTILASIYDKNKSDLTIIFSKGSQYKYPGVSNTDYTRFELAESQGTVLNTHIKKYSFEKLDAIDPSIIVKEIESMKKAEHDALLKVKQQNIVKAMKQLILIDDDLSINLFTESQLETLIGSIQIYLTEYNKK